MQCAGPRVGGSGRACVSEGHATKPATDPYHDRPPHVTNPSPTRSPDPSPADLPDERFAGQLNDEGAPGVQRRGPRVRDRLRHQVLRRACAVRCQPEYAARRRRAAAPLLPVDQLQAAQSTVRCALYQASGASLRGKMSGHGSSQHDNTGHT